MYRHERRLLPPMAALLSFAAAARSENYSGAAAELGLTQGAVSRQIAQLEALLQVRLFDRRGRGVVLTADGRAYAEAIWPALDRIGEASARALRRRPANELSIATLPSFGMRWLAPRLPGFTSRHPALLINFAARSTRFDFAAEDFDAAIHFGAPDWQRAEHDLLFAEESVLVAAPALIERHAPRVPTDLLDVPLLALTSRPDAWAQWFRAAGTEAVAPLPSASFEHFLMLAQAAVAGSGAALMPRFLIEPELQAGQLLPLFPGVRSGTGCYYLVYPADRRRRPEFRSFRDWMLEQAATMATDER